ncbi:MAG: hypothetical protein ACRDWT_06775 [Jatrophihabitantaceae bacterium]
MFTRADALTEGWTDSAIRHAVASKSCLRVKRGVLVGAESDLVRGVGREHAVAAQHDRAAAPDTHRVANLTRARATVRLCQRAVVSHASALIAHDLPTVCAVDRACVTVPAGTALRALADVHLHRASLSAADLVESGGARTTAVARTVLDVAREHGVDAGVCAADAALNRGLLTLVELEDAFARCVNWPGRAAARATIELCDALAESPLESISRLRLDSHCIATPRLQVSIGDEWGHFLARPDFYWPEFGVVGEADGNVKYQSRWDLVVGAGGPAAAHAAHANQPRASVHPDRLHP